MVIELLADWAPGTLSDLVCELDVCTGDGRDGTASSGMVMVGGLLEGRGAGPSDCRRAFRRRSASAMACASVGWPSTDACRWGSAGKIDDPLSTFGALVAGVCARGEDANVLLTFENRVGSSPGSGSSWKALGKVVSEAVGEGRVELVVMEGGGGSDVSSDSASIVTRLARGVTRCWLVVRSSR